MSADSPSADREASEASPLLAGLKRAPHAKMPPMMMTTARKMPQRHSVTLASCLFRCAHDASPLVAGNRSRQYGYVPCRNLSAASSVSGPKHSGLDTITCAHRTRASCAACGGASVTRVAVLSR